MKALQDSSVYIMSRKIRIFSLGMIVIVLFFACSAQRRRDELPELHEAALWGDMARVEALVEKGADVNQQDRSVHSTALHWAILHEQIPVMRFLLSQGANVNLGDINSVTPLHYAAFLGRVTAARLLVAFGADINREDRHFETPLHYAADGDISLQHLVGLPFMGRYQLHDTVHPDHHKRQEIAELLLTEGAAPEAKNQNGFTPLHRAARSGDVVITTLLLSRGVDVNSQSSSFKLTPLYLAALRGHIAVIKLLLSHGADINAKTKKGETPLGAAMRSYSQHKEEVIELLRQHGAKE